jgi:hypothetical protein
MMGGAVAATSAADEHLVGVAGSEPYVAPDERVFAELLAKFEPIPAS